MEGAEDIVVGFLLVHDDEIDGFFGDKIEVELKKKIH